MDSTPDDILRLIFDAYVHEIAQPAIHFLAVSRRWHNLANATPTLWTTLQVTIRSLSTVPMLLGCSPDDYLCQGLQERDDNTPLGKYLSRSWPRDIDAGLSLDISIDATRIKEVEENGDKGGNTLGSTNDSSMYEAQFKLLMTVLAGFHPLDAATRFSSKIAARNRKWIRHDAHAATSASSHGETNRWKSVSIAFPRAFFGLGSRLPNPFGTLRDVTACQALPYLQTLSLRECDFDPSGISFPSLKILNVIGGYGRACPHAPMLETLVDLGGYRSSEAVIPWEDGAPLRTLHIARMNSFSLIPFEYPLPHLSVIRLEAPMTDAAQDALRTLFDKSHPLDTLLLSESSIHHIEAFLLRSPGFHCSKLFVSTRNFVTKPSGEKWCWEWDEHGEITWSVSTEELEAADRLLKMSKERGVELLAMDAHARKVFQIAED